MVLWVACGNLVTVFCILFVVCAKLIGMQKHHHYLGAPTLLSQFYSTL